MRIFSSGDLNAITKQFIDAFCVLTFPYSSMINQLIFEMKPFASLLRLLNHDNIDVINNTIASIDNILYSGAIGSE